MQPPLLFNRNRISLRLKRRGDANDRFIADLVLSDLKDRLTTITRTFSKALIIAPSQEYALDAARTADAEIKFEFVSSCLASDGAQTIDPDNLELAHNDYDLIVSMMDLQTINDVPGYLKRIKDHLKPDGLFLAAALGGESLKELRASWLNADMEIFGGAHARVAPFIDVRDAGQLLHRAGFALPVSDIEQTIVRYEHPLALMDELRKFAATNPMIETPAKATTRKVLGSAIHHYLENYADPDGRVRATLEIIWLSAWSPHESQQKPLAPGSAKMSLKDVLEKKN